MIEYFCREYLFSQGKHNNIWTSLALTVSSVTSFTLALADRKRLKNFYWNKSQRAGKLQCMRKERGGGGGEMEEGREKKKTLSTADHSDCMKRGQLGFLKARSHASTRATVLAAI